MDIALVRSKLRNLCQGREWREFLCLIEGGYKGIFVILRILRDNSTEVVSADLARQLDVTTARIARALNTLEKKGYIERIPSESDGRKVAARITQSGLYALEEREKTVQTYIESIFGKLTEDELNTFLELFGKLLQSRREIQ